MTRPVAIEQLAESHAFTMDESFAGAVAQNVRARPLTARRTGPARRFLFASAPFGPFFAELARALEAEGCQVWRLCFEGGDVWETPARNRIMVPAGTDFAAFIVDRLRHHNVECVVTFNDILPRNRIALKAAEQLGVDRFVLENGYLRPHWVTLERDGVNGFSGLPRERAFYLSQRALQRAQKTLAGVAEATRAPQPFVFRVRYHVMNTIAHFAAAVVASPFLRFDPAYYGDSVWRQAAGYMREYGWRQLNSENEATRRIEQARQEKRPVFTVLMQKPGDGQLIVHSSYGGNNNFLREVIGSFARYAPKNALLVVKQHPLDYGVEKSPAFAADLFRAHGIEDRAVYLRMTSIDICMDHSDGLVTVNSTGGLAALQKGLAVKCMGAAVYNVEGLTFQGSLNSFWRKGRPADPEVLEGYVDHLIRSSQLNGGFHSREARSILLKEFVSKITSTDTRTFD